MIRQTIFDTIAAAIATITDPSGTPIVRHIDYWNENIAYAEQDQPWPRPALFIEFGRITWRPTKEPTVWRSQPFQIRLHIITDYTAPTDNATAFALTDHLCRAITTITPDNHFTTPTLTHTDTNHNHEQLLESIETLTLQALRTIHPQIE